MNLKFDIETVNFTKTDGLIPAILQHYQTKQVLMLGYMNAAALQKTLEERVAWFYSRSKKRLWKKGETSEHYQHVVDVSLDCDRDTLLVLVKPDGPTCHMGTNSCFDDDYFNLNTLEKTIQEKIAQPIEGSYTAYLLKEGLDKILKKNGEEMTEVIIAAKNQDQAELINETSDLLYHLFVLLNQQGVRLSDVEARLAERHGVKQTYSVRSDIEAW